MCELNNKEKLPIKLEEKKKCKFVMSDRMFIILWLILGFVGFKFLGSVGLLIYFITTFFVLNKLKD